MHSDQHLHPTHAASTTARGSDSTGAPRALVLGGAGMLGHKLYQVLSPRMPTYVAVRRRASAFAGLGLFAPDRVIDGVDVGSPHDLHRAFAVARPTVVFNAVGIVKQLKEAHDPVLSLTVNSLLPHQLAALCAAAGARFVHVSTDCVFSGRRGGYAESDVPDAEDLYGRTKLLGEVCGEGALTVRTSIIGRELAGAHGLVEWFLGRRGQTVRGFRRAIYTGLTTLELARLLVDLVQRRPELSGLWQVSSDPISKYDLLHLVNDAYGLGTRIEADDDFVCDRSLDSTRFREATGYRPPSWPEMVAAMRDDPTPYDAWRAS